MWQERQHTNKTLCSTFGVVAGGTLLLYQAAACVYITEAHHHKADAHTTHYSRWMVMSMSSAPDIQSLNIIRRAVQKVMQINYCVQYSVSSSHPTTLQLPSQSGLHSYDCSVVSPALVDRLPSPRQSRVHQPCPVLCPHLFADCLGHPLTSVHY